jgi:hypothetical protein
MSPQSVAAGFQLRAGWFITVSLSESEAGAP